jgi:hypothetical protein
MIQVNKNFEDFPMLYGISFSGSGTYKDLPQVKLNQLCEKVFDQQNEVKNNMYSQLHENMIAKANAEPTKSARVDYKSRNKIRKWHEVCSGGTYQGLQTERIACQQYKIGSTHFAHSEIIDALRGRDSKTMEILSKIKEITLQGDSYSDTIKGSETEHVKGVPQTMMVHGSIAELYSEKGIFESIMGLLATGYARRTLMIFSKKRGRKILTSEKEAQYEEEIKKYEEEIKGIFLDVHNESKPGAMMDMKNNETSYFYKTIKIENQEVKDLIKAYKDGCWLRANDMDNEKKTADLYDRHNKALRLAACIAMLEHPESPFIKLADFDSAIKLCELWGSEFESFLSNRAETATENMYNLIKNQADDQKVSRSSLRDLLPGRQRFNTVMLNSCIEELQEMCNERNEILSIEKGRGVTEYFFIEVMPDHINENDLDSDIVKYSMAETEDLTDVSALPGHCRFQDFHEIVKAKTRYFPCQFKDNVRNTDNYIKGHNLIIFDIDNDGEKEFTIEQARIKFANFKCLIIPTTHHMIEKGKKGIKNRFRVIFPTLPFNFLDKERYKRIMRNMINDLGISEYCDIGAAEKIALPYKCNDAEHWYSDGAMLMNWKVFDYRKSETRKTRHRQMKKNIAVASNVLTHLEVETRNGARTWQDFEFIPHGKSVPCKCIWHDDNKSSAYVSRHKNGSLFLHCVVCNKTVFEG